MKKLFAALVSLAAVSLSGLALAQSQNVPVQAESGSTAQFNGSATTNGQGHMSVQVTADVPQSAMALTICTYKVAYTDKAGQKNTLNVVSGANLVSETDGVARVDSFTGKCMPK